MTVYFIECHQEKNWAATRPWRDSLGRCIAALAVREGAKIWFHGYQNCVDDTPFVMVECDYDFLKKIAKMDGVRSVRLAPAGATTVRSPVLQKHFAPLSGYSPAAPKP